MEYLDFYNSYRNSIAPRVLGIRTVSKKMLESRIRDLMRKAIALDNKELAQVACDLAADEFRSSNDLLSEMNGHWQLLKLAGSEDAQREAALRQCLP